MKKIFIIAVAALSIFSSCRKISTTVAIEGVLSFSSFALDFDASTKADTPAPGNYTIIIRDSDGSVVKTTTYTSVKSDDGTVSLPAGNYTLEARSSEDEVPAAAFEQPVYGISKDFSITAGQTTQIGVLTCTLLQVKATVSYDDNFLESVTGACKTTVTVDPSAPLDYAVSFAGGVVTYDQSAGYFAVNNGSNTTMNIVFSGLIEGKTQKMTANLTGIEPRQWRQIKFTKNIHGGGTTQGDATFSIVINGYTDDEELVVPLAVADEAVIGPDPNAPKGDGGITLDFADGCTMYDDLANIVVPASGTMDLRLYATIPGGIRKFIVEMASTSDEFLGAVDLAGGSTLDLLNPTAEQDIIFKIVPFPHGADLAGKTEVAFDLSAAREPILLFEGKHTFTMTITDMQGCKKSIPVCLIVEKKEE